MTRPGMLRGVLVLVLVLIPANAALANSMSPVLYLPGMLVVSPLLGLPATLAAAVLERPFVSRAGFQRHALTRSIRANLLSWFLGLLIAMLVIGGPGPFGDGSPIRYGEEWVLLGYMIFTVLISILMEGIYYHAILERQGLVLRFRWIVAANVLSSAFLIGTSFAPGIVRSRSPQLEFVVEPYQPALFWTLATISLAIVLLALRPLGKAPPAVPETVPSP